MTKTFNIGEYCKYGTIRVTRHNIECKVEVCDYKTKNVREKASFHYVDKAKMQYYLEDYTTPFHADKIMNHFYI